MGQFKPMVKMMTTEPTVELKLKKGGHVNMKKGGKAEAGHKKMADGGGAMSALMGTPALVGRPAVNAPVRAPGKPPMAARRKAMAAKAPMPAMKKGGESKATHMAEMKEMKGLEKELKSHASKPASKGHKGLKTGGVTDGQGGYKNGGKVYSKGIIPESVSAKGGEGYKNTKMHTAKADHSPAKTGGVKDGNGGGYATGGVAKANGGGYKKGGAPKKAYAAGGTVDSGKPVAMPQGRKKPSTPVSINQLSGTFKKGGSVTPAQGRLMKTFGKENATAMKQAKAQSNEVYSKFQKMKGGGATSAMDEEYFDRNKVDPKEVSDKASRELDEALNPFGMAKELFGKARDAFIQKMPDKSNYKDIKREDAMQKMPEKSDYKDMKRSDALQNMRGQGAVTKTEKSITVSPVGKKRGGKAC
jgi:hypothetical protein